VALGGFVGLAFGAMTCLLTYFGLVRSPTRALFNDHDGADRAARRRHWRRRPRLSGKGQLADGDGQRRLGLRLAAVGHQHRRQSLGTTLIGYTDQPTAMQLVVYLAILAVTFVLMRLYGSPVKAAQPARG